MEIQKLFPIMLGTSIVLVLFDIYFLFKLKKFFKVRQYHVFFNWLIISVGILSFILLLTTNILRYYKINFSSYESMLFVLPTIWYLPKVIISPVLIINDIIKFIRKSFKNKKSTYSNQMESQNESRRKFIQTVSWSMSVVPFGLVTDGYLRTRNNVKVRYINVPISKLPKDLDGFRIIQISDLHTGSFDSPQILADAVFKIHSLMPDVIAVTGDFVNFHPDELNTFIPYLKNLKATYGVFACLGNHDHYMTLDKHLSLKNKIKEMGMELLINENKSINIGDNTIQIAGVDNSSYRMDFGDLKKSLAGLKDYYPTILLCHDPTNWDKEIRRKSFVDLTLSGHTHGGQVGVELMGTTLSPAKLFYKQFAGLYNDKDQYLYVNRGIGTVGPPVRIGINPEITAITLTSRDYYA